MKLVFCSIATQLILVSSVATEDETRANGIIGDLTIEDIGYYLLKERTNAKQYIEDVLEDAKRRRESASEERMAMLKQRDVLQEELSRMRKVHDWATEGFDNADSTGLTRASGNSMRVSRWREIRSRVIDHLVNLPASNNVGRIWSGSGLNALL
ncbi:MAG: hypothetical protein ABGZ35_15895, partial [Planctomycetaceae bacterium]